MHQCYHWQPQLIKRWIPLSLLSLIQKTTSIYHTIIERFSTKILPLLIHIVSSTNLRTEQERLATKKNEVNTEVNNQNNTSELPDLNQAIVNLKVAEFQAKASTEVIKSADDSLGTLLDVTA